MLALTVSFCLVDIIFADGSTSSTLQNGKCATVLHVQNKRACLPAGALEKFIGCRRLCPKYRNIDSSQTSSNH